MTDRGQRVYFKSMSDDWETPQDLFDRLNARYHFDIDVCADEHNAKCERYFTKEQDGLRQEWSGRCWMNPPYGRGISSWMKKAYEASLNGATVVCLVPARTDTAWWHDWAVRGEGGISSRTPEVWRAEKQRPVPIGDRFVWRR